MYEEENVQVEVIVLTAYANQSRKPFRKEVGLIFLTDLDYMRLKIT